jgi:hypothetical protein
MHYTELFGYLETKKYTKEMSKSHTHVQPLHTTETHKDLSPPPYHQMTSKEEDKPDYITNITEEQFTQTQKTRKPIHRAQHSNHTTRTPKTTTYHNHPNQPNQPTHLHYYPTTQHRQLIFCYTVLDF